MSGRVLSMGEVRERLHLKGFKGLYRLINSDPNFVTFKTGDAMNSPRLMREEALNKWIRLREQLERPNSNGPRGGGHRI